LEQGVYQFSFSHVHLVFSFSQVGVSGVKSDMLIYLIRIYLCIWVGSPRPFSLPIHCTEEVTSSL